MLHIKELPASIIKLMWVFPDGAEFKKDKYDATVVISIDPFGGFIELQGFVGKVKRKQLFEVYEYCKKLSEEYGLPVRAERLPGHSLPGFKLIGKWWVLK